MFNKKFKTRVENFSQDYYIVQYAHYRFLPEWQTLCFWFQQSLTDDTECWNAKLLRQYEAEELSEKLKSIDDIKDWYKPYEIQKNNFYKEKERLKEVQKES